MTHRQLLQHVERKRVAEALPVQVAVLRRECFDGPDCVVRCWHRESSVHMEFHGAEWLHMQPPERRSQRSQPDRQTLLGSNRFFFIALKKLQHTTAMLQSAPACRHLAGQVRWCFFIGFRSIDYSQTPLH